MKKKLKLAIVILVLLFFSQLLYPDILKIPKPYGFVNDFADIISLDKEQELEDLIKRFERRTTIEIAVVTLKELGDFSIEDMAVNIFEKWKIGKKEKDNGILLLISLKERKVRIEVGYGLEYIITDPTAGRILDEYGIPYFRDNKFDEGIISTVSAIILFISKKIGIDFKIDEKYLALNNSYNSDNRFSGITLTILFFLFIIFFRFIFGFIFPFWFFGGSFRGRRGFWSSGGWGGFSSGFGGFGGGMSGGGGATRGF